MKTPINQSRFTFSASVNSAVLRDLAYSEEGQSLAVTFQSGKSYLYVNVPKKTAVELFSADSVGEYFNEHIKKVFNYLKVGLSDQRFMEPKLEETEPVTSALETTSHSKALSEVVKEEPLQVNQVVKRPGRPRRTR